MFKKTRFTIRSKIILGYFIIVVCLGLSIFILNGRISSMEKEINFITNHDIEVQNLSSQIESAYLDMVGRHRGFVISGDEHYLNSYSADKIQLQSDYKNLYQLIADNPSQQKNLEAIKGSIEKWISSMGEPTILLKKQNKDPEILAYYQSNAGEGTLNQLRSQTDDFRNIEKGLTQKRIADLHQSNTDFKTGLYLILLLVVVLSASLVIFISGTIVKTINQVLNAISEIASSEGTGTAKRIEINTRDEVRDLGEVTNHLLESHEQQNWLQTSIGDVATAYQGSTQVTELAQAFITKMAFLLNASYGVFYLRTGDQLVKGASFAASRSDLGAAHFGVGEGLVGQCAFEKRIFMIDPVPNHHVKIKTGLGESQPKSMIIFPVEYESRVEGVIELASLEAFTPMQRKLVEQTRGTMGMAINNVLAQMEVQRLLEESQALSEELQSKNEEMQQQAEEMTAQSEELMAQQDELKASNDGLKRSEEQLQRQQEELEQSKLELEKRSELLEAHMRKTEAINEQVEKQNVILEKQAADLTSASKYKSEFLANMSHELRTPLNSLLILSQMLEENKEGNLHPKQVDFARTIHSSGNDLLRLIDEILDLSKVEAGQMKIKMEPVYLEDIKESLWRNFQSLSMKNGIYFHIDLEESLPNTLYTDVHRLQQILKNLLSNAFKFTSQGHVTLRIYRTNHKHSSSLPSDGGIAFSVTDTGIGISMDKKDIIFEAFQQADGSTSRKYGGTGLGLTISRELSALIGGHIEIESQEGVGSTFTLYVPEYEQSPVDSGLVAAGATESDLPAAKPEVLVPRIEWENPDLLTESEVEDDRHGLQPGDRVLLIIEDDIQFAKILLDMARTRKFKGLVALQGDKGLALTHAYKPDAIVLDIHLPVIDGWSILERLKQHPELRHIPVHVISVVDESQLGLTMGAMAYLKKPVSKEQIENALTRIESYINGDLKRLLIVEDDVILRDSMVELIGHDDVVITAVSTGEEALKELQSEPFDCMVMDLGLADISGFELLDRIRHMEKLNHLPIIIYTGKELDMKEETELKKYAESIIIKNVKSQERLFDETALFLHRVEANLPEDRRNILKKLYNNETAFEGKHLLLVEDDIRNIFALTNVLGSYNLKVTFVENGREALDMLEKDQNFDLILMDIMMPEMDGYQAMKAIRAIPKFEKLPIIALTAKAMKEDRQRCIDAGASDYINKPIDIVKLLSLLKVWLYT